MSNTRLKALESRKGIQMRFPEDCPAVVTDTAVGHCSCTGAPPSISGEQIRLRCVSRALHISRTKLLLRATGEWLWFTSEFQNWRSLHEHSFLCLSGSPGCGKSTLTSAVIKYLEEGDKKDGEVVAFYCCDGRYEGSHSVLNIMGVWLAELQGRKTVDSVVARLVKDVMDLESTHGPLSQATVRGAFQAIKHNLKEGETLILVLDGLDDIQVGHDLLEELSALTSQHGKTHSIKVLMSSRTEFATRSGITTPFQIDVDARNSISEDMKEYTDSILSKSLASYEAAMAILRITEKSKGRFLCIRLLFLILPENSASLNFGEWLLSITDSGVINGPFTIYNYMYQSIPECHHRFARYMLTWVLHAARPMYSWELLDVVNSELGTCYQDADIEKATGGLLTMSNTRTVNLVHLSLRDDLMNIEGSLLPGDPQELIARACLGALTPSILLQSLDETLPDDYPMDTNPKLAQTLDIYAKTYWIHHYLLAEPQSTSTPGLLHGTLRKNFPARKAKPQDDSKLDFVGPKTLLEMETARLEPTSLDTINLALRIGVSLGFYKLAKLELDMGATDHVVSSFSENSLHLAAMAGRTRLIKLLTDYGADVNSLCNSDNTPLFHAVASGHHEVVQLLLDSAPATAQIHGMMDELRLESVISEQNCLCGQRRTSFIVGFNDFTNLPFLSPHITVTLVNGSSWFDQECKRMRKEPNLNFRLRRHISIRRMRSLSLKKTDGCYQSQNMATFVIATQITK